MGKYKKKPVYVDAMKYHAGINDIESVKFTGGELNWRLKDMISINLLSKEPIEIMDKGWILKQPNGEVYFCDDKTFHLLYEPVEPPILCVEEEEKEKEKKKYYIEIFEQIRPSCVQAIQYNTHNLDKIRDFIQSSGLSVDSFPDNKIILNGLKYNFHIKKDDWIVREKDGLIYVIGWELFALMFKKK